MNRTRSPSGRSASTVQSASAEDHEARFTAWPNRIFRSTPYAAAVSRTYFRIAGPSAIAFASVHGRNEYPSVYMSESDRMPG